jgi:hypothetical protein
MNGDRFSPAMPCVSASITGLSKREYAAIKILAGLASNPANSGLMPSVQDAVRLTDRLFEALDKGAA